MLVLIKPTLTTTLKEPVQFQLLQPHLTNNSSRCLSGPGVSHFACTPSLGSPICAIFNNGTTKTYQNTCYACADKASISYYTEGACPIVADAPEQLHCPSFKFGVSHFVCIPNDDPVCVRYNNGTLKTIGNSCYACGDSANISYYTNGVCPSSSNPGRVYCRADQRGAGCQQVSSPVCATFKSSGGYRATAARSQTMTNWCTACSNAKADYYVSGKCY